jgi:hypothetical protein
MARCFGAVGEGGNIVSIDQAYFIRLRATAFIAQRLLAELAAEVVACRLSFDPTGDATFPQAPILAP